MTPDQIELLKHATQTPIWAYAAIGISLLVALLVGIDKAGYYLKRKRTANFENGDTVKKSDLVDAFEKAIARAEKNGGTKIIPGRGDICQQHGERIAAVETHCVNAAQWLRSINRKLDSIAENK